VISSTGPLTRIATSPTLNCAVNHAGDTEGEFFGDTACGTLVALGGTLFGPADIPAGGSAAPRTTWTAVSVGNVTGSGTAADPYKVVTKVTAGSTGLEITQTDSYVVGQESYRTDVALTNTSGSALSPRVYRAGDCFLANSDVGFGATNPLTGSVACVESVNGVPGTRIEQWLPLTSGSHFYEAFFDDVWALIGNQLPFPDTCACNQEIDKRRRPELGSHDRAGADRHGVAPDDVLAGGRGSAHHDEDGGRGDGSRRLGGRLHDHRVESEHDSGHAQLDHGHAAGRLLVRRRHDDRGDDRRPDRLGKHLDLGRPDQRPGRRKRTAPLHGDRGIDGGRVHEHRLRGRRFPRGRRNRPRPRRSP
jgi:hypothetical protein